MGPPRVAKSNLNVFPPKKWVKSFYWGVGSYPKYPPPSYKRCLMGTLNSLRLCLCRCLCLCCRFFICLCPRCARFSRATTGQKWGAGLLGALNVFGVLKMGTLVAVLTKLKLKGYTLGAFWGGVAAAYPFIAAYAAVYVATPVIRCLMNAFTNAAVNKRNEARWVAAGQLANMNSSTRRKIEGSKRFKGEERAIRAEDAVFRSDVDATMQKSLDEDKFADFDRRLGTA